VDLTACLDILRRTNYQGSAAKRPADGPVTIPSTITDSLCTLQGPICILSILAPNNVLYEFPFQPYVLNVLPISFLLCSQHEILNEEEK